MKPLSAILAALLVSGTNPACAVVECQRHTPPRNSAKCTTAGTALLDLGNVS